MPSPDAKACFGFAAPSLRDAALRGSQSGAGAQSREVDASGERKSVVGWLLKQLMRMVPGGMTEWIINRSTERITRAANAIRLKDYSSFLRSNETTTP
jgi:hypothetical protein